MSEDLGFIHRFVPGTGKTPIPCLLLLHGTGGDENDLLPIGRSLATAADWVLLSPRGKVLENGMPRFFRRLREGVFDEEDVKFRANELADFVEAAAKVYDIDRGRIIAVGYSNGANIAAAMMLLRPEIVSGAILFRAMVPLTNPELPDLSKVRVFLAAGRRDPIVPAENTGRLAEMLRQAGSRVDIHWSDGGHNLEPEELRAAKLWLTEAGNV